jgi:CelD/BcsL family acetyltransferase involved in cellulose biosynthesis
MKTVIHSNRAKLINPLDDERWDKFVSNHPFGVIYHHSSWMRVLSLTYRHLEPLCFVLEDENDNIRAALPCFIVRSKLTGTRLVSLPFSSYSDPLVEDREDFSRLLDETINELEHTSASYFELRCFRNIDSIKDERLTNHNYYKTHILAIEEGFKNISQLFHKDCIVRSIKKALKSGVAIKLGCSEQDLKKFYVLHGMTRKRQGFPIQPYEFFRNIWEIMSPLGFFNLLLAEYDKKIVAGLVLFKFKDTVSFEHGASIPKFLSVRPNHLLLSKAIEIACSQGYRYFDLGKTPPENKGLLDFKRRWGARMYDVPYFYYPRNQGIMSLEQKSIKHRLLLTIGKYAPFYFAKILGRIAYHHLG